MALNPQQDPYDEDRTDTQPTSAWTSPKSHTGPRWWWTVLGIAVLIVAGVIIYFAFYGGGSSSTPSSGGGGYAVLALSAEQLRRIRNRLRLER